MPSWEDLNRLTRGEPFEVEKVRLSKLDVAIEGRFPPPPLACLTAEDQVFVMAFVRAHGSIKEMERVFGISYPTVKTRLNRIGEKLPLVRESTVSSPGDVLAALDRGDITAAQAIAKLEG